MNGNSFPDAPFAVLRTVIFSEKGKTTKLRAVISKFCLIFV